MSGNKRQWLVVGIAGLCVIIAGGSLFSGGGSAPANPSPAPAVSSPEPSSNPPSLPQLEPAMYQRLRERLMSFPAEHQEPFRELKAAAMQTPSESRTPTSRTESNSRLETPPFLSVPPLTVQPTPHHPQEAEQNTPTHSATDSNQTPTIRLRGVVRDRNTRQVNALLEVNGQIVVATQEPHSEWQILTLTPTQLIVRHHDKTYTVEVSNAK